MLNKDRYRCERIQGNESVEKGLLLCVSGVECVRGMWNRGRNAKVLCTSCDLDAAL